jgi:hypothetical protein
MTPAECVFMDLTRCALGVRQDQDWVDAASSWLAAPFGGDKPAHRSRSLLDTSSSPLESSSMISLRHALHENTLPCARPRPRILRLAIARAHRLSSGPHHRRDAAVTQLTVSLSQQPLTHEITGSVIG